MNVGYVVGKDGLVERTDDDGITWVVKPAPSGDDLLSVSVSPSDADHVVTVGMGGTLAVSTDGGTTWNVPSGSWSIPTGNKRLWKVERAKHDESYIWVGGDDKNLFLSVDNGLTFNIVNVPSGAQGAVGWYDITDLSFWDNDSGIIVSNVSSIQMWKTTDQGVTWTQLGSATIGGAFPIGLETHNNGQIIYSGSWDKFYKSTDGGVNFSSTTPFAQQLSISGFISSPSPTHVFVGGSSKQLYRSTDSGATFTQIDYALGSGSTYGAGDWIDGLNGLYARTSNIYADADGLVTFPTGIVEPAARAVYDIIYTPLAVRGCMDINSCNYDPLAVVDDETCDYRFILTDCDAVAPDIITDTNLVGQLGNIVRVEGICYSVAYYTDDCIAGTGVSVVISRFDIYDDCVTCNLVYGCTDPNACNYNADADVDDGSCTYKYRLTDCDAVESDIITDIDLSAEVGNVIKLETTGDVCWTVSYYTDDCDPATAVINIESYITCEDCLPIPSVPFETVLDNIAVDSECSMITFDDVSNFASGEDGHSMADFDTYRVITITRFNGETYTLSSLGDGDEVITTGSTGDINYAYLFQTDINGTILDEDGLYEVEICNYPTWTTLATYDLDFAAEIIVYHQGELWQAIDTSTAAEPDLSPTEWELYEPTMQEMSLSRYCSMQKIVVLCLSILACYDRKVLDSVCSDKDFCSDYAVCDNDSLLAAMKIRLMIDAVENSVNNLQYEEAVRQIDIMKQICNC